MANWSLHVLREYICHSQNSKKCHQWLRFADMCPAGECGKYYSNLVWTCFGGIKPGDVFTSTSPGLPGWYSLFIKLFIANPHQLLSFAGVIVLAVASISSIPNIHLIKCIEHICLVIRSKVQVNGSITVFVVVALRLLACLMDSLHI